MKTDLVLSPFGAQAAELLAAAQAADAGGFDVVWTYDHFGGAVAGAGWSRDPFVTLGAIAAVTGRVGLGVLVANVANRHPAQLASAVNTLQALAPGRVWCGLGAGAAPGSQFAVEQEAVGRSPEPGPARRERLLETIECLRALWRGESYRGNRLRVDPAIGVVDDAPLPPMIVGGSSEAIVRFAVEHADGVNLLDGPRLPTLVALARRLTANRPFDVSVFTDLDPGHPEGGDAEAYRAMGIDRRTLAVKAPFPIDAIGAIGARLRELPSEPSPKSSQSAQTGSPG